ncbi:unnamed protein product [Danaus chrysippus]|uniref:(African queen) hypothetical protein n=1 Tax=Danaus chrysippus TaxID=151541 RepID=A0A8J2WB48_9NEOP|nr:unnamed protein product [Danaus chrysippus]
MVACALLNNGVYKLQIQENVSAAAIISGELWHRRLGHVNSGCLNKMQNAVDGLSLKEKVDITKSTCTVCCEVGDLLPIPDVDCDVKSSDETNNKLVDQDTSIESEYEDVEPDLNSTLQEGEQEKEQDINKRERRPPERFGYSNLCTSSNEKLNDPVTVQEALQSSCAK